jgi:hypothetical protein
MPFQIHFLTRYLDIPRLGRHLMDDDIRLITRAGQRRLADDDFADIFDFGEGRSNIFHDRKIYMKTLETIYTNRRLMQFFKFSSAPANCQGKLRISPFASENKMSR